MLNRSLPRFAFVALVGLALSGVGPASAQPVAGTVSSTPVVASADPSARTKPKLLAAGESHQVAFDEGLVDLINEYRLSKDLPPVTTHAGLTAKAVAWGTHLSEVDMSPYGNAHASGDQILSDATAVGCTSGTAGETIAMNTPPYANITPLQTFNRYMQSSTHRTLIENPSFRFIGSGTIKNSANRIFNVVRYHSNCNVPVDDIIVPTTEDFDPNTYRFSLEGKVYGQFSRTSPAPASINLTMTKPDGSTRTVVAYKKMQANNTFIGWYEYYYLEKNPLTGTYTITTPGENSFSLTYDVNIVSSFHAQAYPSGGTYPVGTDAPVSFTLTPSLGRPVVVEKLLGGAWVEISTQDATSDYGVQYTDPLSTVYVNSPEFATQGTYRLRAPEFEFGNEVISDPFDIEFTKATAAQTTFQTAQNSYQRYVGEPLDVNFNFRPGFGRTVNLQSYSGSWTNISSTSAVNGANVITVPASSTAGTQTLRLQANDAPAVGDAVVSPEFTVQTIKRPVSLTAPANTELFVWQGLNESLNNQFSVADDTALNPADMSATWTLTQKKPDNSTSVVGTGVVDASGKFAGLNLDELDFYEPGNHELTLTYAGNTTYEAASKTFVVNAKLANRSANLSLSKTSVSPTDTITATVVVSTNNPQGVTARLEEKAGDGAWTTLATYPGLMGNNNTKTFTIPARPAGSYQYRVVVAQTTYSELLETTPLNVTRQAKTTNVTGWFPSTQDFVLDSGNLSRTVNITWSESRPYRVEARHILDPADQWTVVDSGTTPAAQNASLTVSIPTGSWKTNDRYQVRLVLPQHGEATEFVTNVTDFRVVHRDNKPTLSAPTTAPAGGTFVVKITTPAQPKAYQQHYAVQERIGNSWVDLATGYLTTSTSAKTFNVTVKAGYSGSKVYRVLFSGTGELNEYVSPQFVVKMVKGSPVTDVKQWKNISGRIKGKATKVTIKLAPNAGAWRFERQDPKTKKWKVVKKGSGSSKASTAVYNVPMSKKVESLKYRFVVDESNYTKSYRKTITVKTAKQKSTIKNFPSGTIKVKANSTYKAKKVQLSHKATLQVKSGGKWKKVKTYKKGTRTISMKVGKKKSKTQYRLRIKATSKVTAKTVKVTLRGK